MRPLASLLFIVSLLSAPSLAIGQGLALWERAGLNVIRQSNSASSGTTAVGWTQAGTTVATVGAPSQVGGGTWAEVTSTGVFDQFFQDAVLVSPTNLFVGSAWMAKPTGSGTAGLIVLCSSSSVLSCTCSRSDGGSCTTTTPAPDACLVNVQGLGTAPVRAFAFVACAGPVATTRLSLLAGEFGASASTTRFAGMQIEPGVTTKSSLIVTKDAARYRRAGLVGVKNL